MKTMLDLPRLVSPHCWEILPVGSDSAWVRLTGGVTPEGTISVTARVSVNLSEAETPEQVAQMLSEAAYKLINRPGFHIYRPREEWTLVEDVLQSLAGRYTTREN